MRCPALVAVLLVLLSLVLAAQDFDLDAEDGETLELNVGERAAAERARRRAVPGRQVVSWDFNKASLASKDLPNGWFAGTWGERRVNYGTEPTDEDGTNRAMKIDVRYIVGGELQVFSGPWAMVKGGWYRLTFRAKGFDHYGHVTVMVRKYGYPWSELQWPCVTFRPTEEWKEYSIVKRSEHTISSGFGVLVKTGSVGKFLIDDVKVESFLEDPRPPTKPRTPVPVTPGNLVPRGSFESKTDPFWADESVGTDPYSIWYEPRHDIVEGGRDGRRAMRLRKEAVPAGHTQFPLSVWSLPVSVATGRVYTVSGWAKTTGKSAHFSLGFVGGEGENAFECGTGGEIFGTQGWRFFSAKSAPIPSHIRSIRIRIGHNTGDEVIVDSLNLTCDLVGKPEKFVPAAPCELELNFAKGDPLVDPRVVTWGEKLPLEIGAWEAKAGTGVREIPAMLRVTAYPDKVTVERRVVLVVGTSTRLDLDPQVNGVLRVELVPDDPKLAKPIEVVMARLPKPRATGVRGRFGSHMRVCPSILNYARAIGLTWQRMHDCSLICKMKWGNPQRGAYNWADEMIDGIRARGFEILALPDSPPDWLLKKEYVLKESERKEQAKKDSELDLASGVDEDDDGILSEMKKKTDEADRKLKSDLVVLYDAEAYRTWCRELAKHYGSRITHYEIWNEPYMQDFFKGSAAEFGKVFSAGASGIRDGNPNAKVIGWCTEIMAPHFVNSFLTNCPVASKPDVNSLHCYFTGVPGDGEIGYENIVKRHFETYGERVGSEIWNTEGNLGGGSSFYSHVFSPESAEEQAAFGVRCWSETFFGGMDRFFVYSMHNTDAWRNGGLMNTIDYDRSVNVWGAATATTAWFIDAMEPHPEIKSPEGVKLRVFSGDGRVSAVLFDDCLVPGRPRLDASKLPKDWLATDAMGNDLRPHGAVELGRVPVFILRPCEEDCTAFVSAIEAAIHI